MSQTNHRLTELDPISRQDFLNEVKNTLIEYRFNLDIPKNITYGVEIEAQGPIMAPLSHDEYLIQPLEEYAQLNRHRGIDFEYCPWLLKKDSSFVKAHIEGAEVASPILTNISEDWEMLEYVCTQIKAAGGYIGAYSGGHIHFGEDDFFKTHEPLDLIKVLKTWAAFEPIIYRFGAGEYLNYRTTMYEYASYLSRDIKRYFSNLYDYENYSYLDILDKLGFTNCRGLKFSHLRDYYIEKEKPIEFKQTLEIRSPNGTLEPAIWQNNINFFYHLLKYAVTDYDDDFISALIMESLTLKPYSDRGFTKNNAELNLDRALELADLIYTTDLDKIYFLKQYIKDGQNLSLDEDEMKKPLRLTK